jgi:hypothetical protein
MPCPDVRLSRYGGMLFDADVPPASSSPAAPVASDPAKLAATPFTWVDPATIPQRAWLYGKTLIRRQLTLTVAHPGVGKSRLCTVEALSMATRRMLLWAMPAQHCRVWLWNGEDTLDEMQRNVAAAIRHFELQQSDIGDRLFLNSGRQCPIIIAKQSREGVTIATPVYDALVKTIKDNKIDVVIIDPFISCHRVNENDNGAIDDVAKTYAKIADETGCAIHLVHHSRKTGGEAVDVEFARGASALLGAVRCARTLNFMTEDEAAKADVKNRFEYVRIDNGKANLAPRSDSADWLRMVSVHLDNGPQGSAGDSVDVVTRWSWPDPAQNVTSEHQTAITLAIAMGRYREDVQAAEWVGKPIADVLGLDISEPAHREKIKGLIKRWIKTGLFQVVQGEDQKRNKRSFIQLGASPSQHSASPHPAPL